MIAAIGGIIATMVGSYFVNVKKEKNAANKEIEIAKINANDEEVDELNAQLREALERVKELEENIANMELTHQQEIANLETKYREEIARVTAAYESVKNGFSLIYGTLLKILQRAESEEGVELVKQLMNLTKSEDGD